MIYKKFFLNLGGIKMKKKRFGLMAMSLLAVFATACGGTSTVAKDWTEVEFYD